MPAPLSALAHNVLVWARSWLAPHSPRQGRLGVARWVRDVLGVSGIVEFDATGAVQRIWLNAAHPLARDLVRALTALLAPQQVAVILGEI